MDRSNPPVVSARSASSFIARLVIPLLAIQLLAIPLLAIPLLVFATAFSTPVAAQEPPKPASDQAVDREKAAAHKELLALDWLRTETEARVNTLQAVAGADADEARKLLDAYLTRYAYSPGGKQLSAELHAIAQRAEARAYGGRGLSEKQELAVSLLRTIFNTAPESPAGQHAWDRFTTSHRFPQFLRPQVEVRWQPETDLLASNGVRPRVELKSTLWRFRSEKVEREWQNDNFRHGEPLELRLAPRGLNLEDLVQVNQPVNWELNAKTRESWRAAYEPRWKATVKLESGGWYYLLQELDGFKFFQPLRVVSFRLITRMISGTGRPGIVMAIDPWTGEGVKGVQLRLTGTEARRAEADVGAERPNQPPSKPKVDEREARQVWIDLGVTDERGICSVQLPFERHLSELEIEGRRGDERWRCELTNAFMQEDDSPRPEDAHKIKYDELDRERTVLITTDRPLYRPGQEVRYKAVMRDGAGRLVAQPEQPVRVEIRDIGGRLYHSAEHRWNEFGSLSGKWTLADEPNLGEYTISVAVRRPLDDDGGGLGGPRAFFRGGGGIFEFEEPWHAYWSETFVVAAYRKPEFEVLIAGGKQPGTAEVSAEYFVGGKLTDADVEWKVMLVDKIDADSAGGDWGVKTYEALAPLDDPRAWFYHGRIADEKRVADLWNERLSGDLSYLRYARAKVGKPLAEGKGRTDANGKLAIKWKAPPAELSAGKKVTIHATVRDASRLAVDGSLDLTGPKPRLKLEVGTERLFAEPNTPMEVRVRASLPGGEPVVNQKVELEGLLTRVVLADGSVEPETFVRETLQTDARGRARIVVKVPGGGRVRWRATTTIEGDGGAGDGSAPAGAPSRAAAKVVARVDQWSAGREAIDVDSELNGREPFRASANAAIDDLAEANSGGDDPADDSPFDPAPGGRPSEGLGGGPNGGRSAASSSGRLGMGFGTGDMGAGGMVGAGKRSRSGVMALTITPDQFAYASGEKVRLLVRSAIAPIRLFVGLEARTTQRVEPIEIRNQVEVIEIPVTEADRGLATVWVLGVSDRNVVGDQRNVYLFPERQVLQVDVRTDKAEYSPRQKAKVGLQVRGFDGAGRRAEVELGLIDESILSLREDGAPHPVVRFSRTPEGFAVFQPEVMTPSSASRAWQSYAPEPGEVNQLIGRSFAGFGAASTSDLLGGGGMGGGFGGGFGGGGLGGGMGGMGGGSFGGGGGFFGGPPSGGGAPFAAGGAALMNVAPELRENFADTWHWVANVVTDDAGRAVVELDAPDTLTRWRIVARAVTRAGESGMAKSTTLTRQRVMARLIAPRFFTKGDEATVSTIVRSDLDQPTEFKVRLQAGAAALGERVVRVDARSQQRVDWPLKIVDLEPLRLKAEAISTVASDAVQMTIPVRHAGYDHRVVRRDRFTKNWTGEIALPAKLETPEAEVELMVDAGPTSAIRGALPYLAGYPYGCVEQTMSKFLPAVAATLAMRRAKLSAGELELELPTMVDQGLQRLLAFQHDDGGWGWWKEDTSDVFMSAYVLEGLLTARDAGFTVDPKVIESAVDYLSQQQAKPYLLYVLALAGDKKVQERVRELPIDQIPKPGKDDARKYHGLMQTPVEQLAYMVLAGRDDFIRFLPLDPPRANDDRGAQAIRETALVIRAIAKRDPRNAVLPSLVEWLLGMRDGAAWVSTFDSAHAVLALSELPLEDKPVRWTLSINERDVPVDGERRFILKTKLLRPGENSIVVRTDDARKLYLSLAVRCAAVDPPHRLNVAGAAAAPDGKVLKEVGKEVAKEVGKNGAAAGAKANDDIDPFAAPAAQEVKPAKAPRSAPKNVDEDRLALNGFFMRQVWRFVKREEDGREKWEPLKSGATVSTRDRLRVTLEFDGFSEHLMLESPLAAGLEPRWQLDDEGETVSYLSARRETRDDRVCVAGEYIGRSEFSFEVRPTLPGRYRMAPAVAFDMYEPDRRRVTDSFELRIAE